jgi:hypothetical protein
MMMFVESLLRCSMCRRKDVRCGPIWRTTKGGAPCAAANQLQLAQLLWRSCRKKTAIQWRS